MNRGRDRKGIHLNHGDARRGAMAPEYHSYRNMISRCFLPSFPQYPDYGGRGITVCGAWRSSYYQFLTDMGRQPTKSHSLERIDNNGNYEPGNVKWATPKEQARNTRRNHFVEIRGERKTISEWSEILGLKYSTIYYRLTKGSGLILSDEGEQSQTA